MLQRAGHSEYFSFIPHIVVIWRATGSLEQQMLGTAPINQTLEIIAGALVRALKIVK